MNLPVMNVDKLKNKLLEAARAEKPSDRVPYAFEKRIMARIPELRELDAGALWARALWRAAAPCLGVALALAAWTAFSPEPQTQAADFSEDFENTVLAVVDQDSGADYIW